MSKVTETSLRRMRDATGQSVNRAAKVIGTRAKRVSARANAVREGAGDTIGAAKLKADRAAMEATRIITEHPLAAVAAAAALGALAAGLLPRFLGGKRDDPQD